MQWLIIAGIVVIGLLALSVLFRIFKAVAGIAVLVLVIWLCFHFIHGFTVNALLQDFRIVAGYVKSVVQIIAKK